ncbi:hypothetical protein ACTFR8_22070 [Bacillus cereus group sp. MYBK15-3]|uniref:hypothetical protein n=1 Tax=Bacillus cereus group TaxID=86661 RepID=UPI001C8B72DF|nr:hypothetical protein [Bacillus cereus]MBX9158287.1 hypothetical protein [Bacillus cereus]
MLKENYVLSFIQDELDKGTDVKLIESWLAIGKEAMEAIQLVRETGETLGSILSGNELIKVYRAGLTYPEIAELKGVTRVAVRLMVHSVTKGNLPKVKEENRLNRQRMRDAILHRKVWIAVQLLGFDEAKEQSGYSESFFRQRYREMERNMRNQLNQTV